MFYNEANHIPFRRECYRKLTHLGALAIPGAYYYLNLSRTQMLAILVPIAVAMIFIDIARLRDWKLWRLFRPMIGSMAREHEIRGDFTGAAYILATACLVIALFDRSVAMSALAFIITGDVAAALIGRKFGNHKYKHNHKSFEGSFAFLIAAGAVAFFIPDLSLSIGLIGAFTATVVEAISIHIDDNATVPLVSGLVMHLLCFIM